LFWVGVAQIVVVGDQLVGTLGIGNAYAPTETILLRLPFTAWLAYEMPILGASLADAVFAPEGATVAVFVVWIWHGVLLS
jgi:hypothetical protein